MLGRNRWEQVTDPYANDSACLFETVTHFSGEWLRLPLSAPPSQPLPPSFLTSDMHAN